MNKRNMLGTLVLAATCIFAQETVSETFLWDGGTDTLGRVLTGSNDKTSGYLFDFTDKREGGETAFTFPNEIKANDLGNFYGPLVAAYHGIKATITLGEGYNYPYAAIGFNIWNDEQKGVDISGWGGICLAYQSTIGFSIEVVPENEKEVTGEDNYMTTVLKSPSAVKANFQWGKYSQRGWGTEAPIDDVLAHAASIRIRFEGTAGTSGNFRICQIGSLNQCTGCADEPTQGIGDAGSINAAASSVKVQLAGRVLHIQGNSSAKVEVINLQGQIVKSATASSAMDLSSLDAGVYMVRIAGKSANFSQKILLK
ncbi:MAG: T9SS type A sorting domain-containing protein [Fibrobacter sp.]|nr:T9SS type A sorting domain-containing protein [Fibrobacter sp.]